MPRPRKPAKPAKPATLRFLRKALKRHARAESIVTDGLKSYPAAMRELGNEAHREVGRHANNRAENSDLPFPTARASHAAIPVDEITTEIRLRPRLSVQPL
ncbi:DDE-type integrase/transposase/recombinase [Novosphingobium sp.]|uniref:DDE-type integrase/transposase/recombinase n=1 Tax=Novosphingobium sp. TaxID=1874826 RepID=UPI00273625E1|nr:DDE-type integrase/transposase/recombinase [Novosphingobium sp.]MDP3908647.1 DDE-type integrase/transposase/recombinase [Novosphingobium sp.]